MKTAVTNRIRFVLDELLPRFIRNSRLFVYPIFLIWFKGRHVRTAMDFKTLAPAMSDAEFRDCYRRITTLADGRPTDTNPDAMQYVLSRIAGDAHSLLDVGCGRGFFLHALRQRFPLLRLFGCDLRDRSDIPGASYIVAAAERLPFDDDAFDVVTCFHTLEHTRRLELAVAELRRVTRRQLIVVVPQQQYFRYTFDLHLRFFPTAAALEAAMGMGGEIRQFGSDLVYVAMVS